MSGNTASQIDYSQGKLQQRASLKQAGNPYKRRGPGAVHAAPLALKHTSNPAEIFCKLKLSSHRPEGSTDASQILAGHDARASAANQGFEARKHSDDAQPKTLRRIRLTSLRQSFKMEASSRGAGLRPDVAGFAGALTHRHMHVEPSGNPAGANPAQSVSSWPHAQAPAAHPQTTLPLHSVVGTTRRLHAHRCLACGRNNCPLHMAQSVCRRCFDLHYACMNTNREPFPTT